KPEKPHNKKTGENQDTVNQAFFGGKVHENCRHQPGLQRGHQHGNGYVGLVSTEVDVRQRDGDHGKREQERAHHQITSYVLLYAVRVFLVFLRILRNIRWIVHALEEIKKRKYKNPDQIDKVPEKAAHLDAIRQMFRVALVKFLADRQPHVNEDDHSGQHVQAVQTGNCKITGEISAVSWEKHRRTLDIRLLDRSDFVSHRQRYKVRP